MIRRQAVKDIQLIDIKSTEYPANLREIPGPPAQLYCRGDISLLHERSIAVVGSRRHTIYGKNVALMIGRRLAQSGIPVVSGFALGIDAFSHRGSLDEDGRIIGVLGSGLDRMGPERNRKLMEEGLEKGGLVVSEYAPDEAAHKGSFPARNRIISGLAEATVVVEADLNSGSLITAKHAASQGRSVYAVPGNINSRSSIGCNLLIRDGAVPLIVIDDIIRDIGKRPGAAGGETEALDSDEKKVFSSVISRGGATMDEIAVDAGMDPSAVSALVTVMEIKGVVESYGGRIYAAQNS